MKKDLFIYCGRTSHKLAREVCHLLGVSLADLDIECFADKEPWYCISDHKKISGKKVFIIQSTSEYAPETYFDLWGIMHAIKRCRPKNLVVIMPFMGFRRQERDRDGGEAVMAELMGKFTVAAGATHIVLCEPHAPILKKYFKPAKVIVIDPNPVFKQVLKGKKLSNYLVLSPDTGRGDMASQFAKSLSITAIKASKSRTGHDQVESCGIDGHVNLKGKTVIIREDEISTGGTIVSTTEKLKKAGATNVIVMATHGVLAGGAVQKLKKVDDISKIYITDSIYLPWEKMIDKIEVLSIAPLIAKVIKQIQERVLKYSNLLYI